MQLLNQNEENKMDCNTRWWVITVFRNTEKLMEIKGIGLVTFSGFIAEVGDIEHFDTKTVRYVMISYRIFWH